MTSRSDVAAIAAAILALLLWSGTAIANKFAVSHIDAISAGALRSLLAGLIALGVCIAFQLQFPAGSRNRLLLIVSGFASFAVWPSLLSIGIEHTTAGHAALIMAMLPVLTVLLASLANRTAPPSGWWLGAVVALTGAAYLVLSPTGVGASVNKTATLIGDVTVFAGCFVCATGYVAGGKLSPIIGAVATTFWGLAAALIILVPVFVLRIDKTAWSTVPTSGWLAIVWMAILSSLVGYALWFFALGQGGIAKIGTLQLLMPMTTLLAASVVLNEKLTLRLAAVCLLIMAGTYSAHRHSS